MFSGLLTFIVRHAKYIPETALRNVFTIAADMVWLFHLPNVKQLERNLQHVMGSVSYVDLRKTSRQNLRSYFAYFSEALTVGGRSEQELLARLTVAGTAYPQPAQSAIKTSSMPIVAGHQGNWDYAGFWAAHMLGPVTTVAERLSDPVLLQDFVQIRRGLGMNVLLTGKEGLTQELIRVVQRKGQIVPLLADRDLGRNGVFVHAFDSIIRVAAGPAVIALETRLPLYTVNMHRVRLDGKQRSIAHNPYGYSCQLDGPIPIEPFLQMPHSQAVQELTQAWVDQWSSNVKEWPQDWHMLQPIFIEDLDLERLHNVPDDLKTYMRERHKTESHSNLPEGYKDNE